MKVLIISNISEQKGLYRDALVVSSAVESNGHTPIVVDFRDGNPGQYDLAIHLEVVCEWFFNLSRRHWWIPNPDWATDTYLCHSERFEKILCKTHDTERIFKERERRPSQVTYTGFTCEDHYDPSVNREKVFFHAKQNSIVKGTDAILDAKVSPLVIASGNLSDQELKREQNRCLFHLQPSQYEGFGHALHEGMSCGAIVVSTNIPPMTEYDGIAYRIPPFWRDTVKLAEFGLVDGGGVAESVRWCLSLPDDEIERLSKKARQYYLDETVQFKQRFAELLRTT